MRRRDQILNFPNFLTFGRIAAVPLIVACFFIEGDGARWLALGLFIVAAISDFFDGYLARLWSQQSSLGRMLDPIADKLLVAAVLLMLTAVRTIDGVHVVAAVIILLREVLVSGLREYLAELRVSVPVTRLAKWKTTLQMVAIALLIAGAAGDRVMPFTTTAGLVGLWISALLTLYTGYDYLKAGLDHVMEDGGQ
ncbi:CDP-diacylglycerol--glycerol-3-phosphate 3-phosphatidyltransferase [Rhodoligotrophos defluvii]|uniref:CDP-diacylglycerol--glycerol-3-phosphate 3-phosphatidyltransferase n=1 Tax=Rhodoligotrophos defluvii TaxID=2561934 RepID=UPI0010C9583E|nr:CDP-diacylglycerol--glycerol-3-phosphate 3-phosphatidyltransferase [Rhodoligotrophos defluvii]